MENGEIDLEVEPGGHGDIERCRAEGKPDDLDEDQRKSPRGQQRIERAIVERSDQEALDHPAEKSHHDKGQRNADEEGYAELGLEHIGREGAEHDELAMRHVDDAHGPVDDGETQCRDQPDACNAQPDEQGIEKGIEFERGPEIIDAHVKSPALFLWRRLSSVLRRLQAHPSGGGSGEAQTGECSGVRARQPQAAAARHVLGTGRFRGRSSEPCRPECAGRQPCTRRGPGRSRTDRGRHAFRTPGRS